MFYLTKSHCAVFSLTFAITPLRAYIPAVSSWWLSLQHDWYDGFANSEKVWVSAHHISSKTCHSFLTSSGPKDDLFTSKLVSVQLCSVGLLY